MPYSIHTTFSTNNCTPYSLAKIKKSAPITVPEKEWTLWTTSCRRSTAGISTKVRMHQQIIGPHQPHHTVSGRHLLLFYLHLVGYPLATTAINSSPIGYRNLRNQSISDAVRTQSTVKLDQSMTNRFRFTAKISQNYYSL